MKTLQISNEKKLEGLLEVEYLDTVKAYDMKLRLQDFYSSHDAYDERLCYDFEDLVLSLCNCAIHEINKFGQMLSRNAVEILNYFETKRTNAILKGFNSKISIIKNRARGFRSMKNFINMINVCCGNLSIPFVLIML